MKLDLDRQPGGASTIAVDGTLDLEMGEEYPAQALVGGELAVQNLTGRVLLSGTLVAEGTAVCGRCLVDFPLTWDVPVDIMVLRDVHSDEEEGETLLVLQRDGEVDLREPIRECAVLAYPTTTVCRDDCRGLCPHCGADLNKETCACAAEDHDPRWDGLP